MTIRMKHPQHGWTHAYSASEVETLQKRGWEVEQPPKPAEVVPEAPPPEVKKRGRPKKGE